MAKALAWREQHNISIEGRDVLDPLMTFDAVDWLPKFVKKAFVAQGFERPTPIQSQCWPFVMAGRDVIAIAKTGSGKTLGFIVPVIALVKQMDAVPQTPVCCVLAPTRELAQQIDSETKKVLGKHLYSTVVYGGVPKGPQADELRAGPQIVVGTPGRMLDFIESGVLNLSKVFFFVLDEADRMLDLGFEPSVKAICSQLPQKRQTVMFSATWPEAVRELAKSFLKDPVRINVGSLELLASGDVKQRFVFVQQDRQKLLELRRILRENAGKRILVFALFKKSVDFLENQLHGTGCIAIHSDKSQHLREKTLDQFRRTPSSILIATDVAARGLDVKELELVVNYEFPLSVDDYVHRIGRTGRAGASGEAITILSDTEAYFDGFAARDLERVLQNVGQPVPPQIAAKAENFRYRARPSKAGKKDQPPPDVAFSVAAPSKSVRFDDSDGEADAPAAKRQRAA